MLVLRRTQLTSGPLAQRGVEGVRWLVQWQNWRLEDDGACDGDALALAATQLVRIALIDAGQSHDIEYAHDPFANFIAADAPHPESERDVVEDCLVGKQGIVLENESHVPVRWFQISNIATTHDDRALARLGEAGYDVERRGLATAGGTQKGEKLTLLDRKADRA